MNMITRTLTLSCMLWSLAQAVTAQKLPVYHLPFYEDEYPFEITLTLNNSTQEPIFFATRRFDGSVHGNMMLEPFETISYTLTIPAWNEISKTWLLFSFNEDTLQKATESLNTGRHIRHVVRTQSEALGIVTIERQKKITSTPKTITINKLNLSEQGAWTVT